MNYLRRLLVTMTLLTSGAVVAQTYIVDPATTDIQVLVYRGGLLRNLGHNHIISVEEVSGTIVLGPTPGESKFQLHFPVSGLVIDESALRNAEGAEFSGEISRRDKEGTRKNMLGRKLLDTENFRDIRLVSSGISGELASLRIEVAVRVRNSEHNLVFPVAVELNGNELVATGERLVSHADLGLKPFRAAFGTLRVRTDMLLRYRVVALEASEDDLSRP